MSVVKLHGLVCDACGRRSSLYPSLKLAREHSRGKWVHVSGGTCNTAFKAINADFCQLCKNRSWWYVEIFRGERAWASGPYGSRKAAEESTLAKRTPVTGELRIVCATRLVINGRKAHMAPIDSAAHQDALLRINTAQLIDDVLR